MGFIGGLLLGGLLAPACGDLPRFRESSVTRLRILAIRAEPPEAAPEERVILSALVVDPTDGGGSPLFLWGACPGSSGDPLACTRVEGFEGLSVSPEARYTIPQSSVTPLPEGKAILIGLLVTTLARYEVGFKRVVVGTEEPRNRNPRLARLSAAPLACPPSLSHACPLPPTSTERFVLLTAEAAPDAGETYRTSNGVLQEERLVMSWFVTAGALDGDVTVGPLGENLWIPPQGGGAPTGTNLYVVLRDNRGGADWVQRTLGPDPAGPSQARTAPTPARTLGQYYMEK